MLIFQYPMNKDHGNKALSLALLLPIVKLIRPVFKNIFNYVMAEGKIGIRQSKPPPSKLEYVFGLKVSQALVR